MVYDPAHVFQYHTPKKGQPQKVEKILEKALELAQTMSEVCPESRELSVARTNLETSVLWAREAIARDPNAPVEYCMEVAVKVQSKDVAEDLQRLRDAFEETGLMLPPQAQGIIVDWVKSLTKVQRVQAQKIESTGSFKPSQVSE